MATWLRSSNWWRLVARASPSDNVEIKHSFTPSWTTTDSKLTRFVESTNWHSWNLRETTSTYATPTICTHTHRNTHQLNGHFPCKPGLPFTPSHSRNVQPRLLIPIPHCLPQISHLFNSFNLSCWKFWQQITDWYKHPSNGLFSRTTQVR